MLNKKYAILFCALLLLIVVLLFILSRSKPNPSFPTNLPSFSGGSPKSTLAPSSTPAPSLPTSGFRITSGIIAHNPVTIAEPIKIDFNKPVDNMSLSYSLSPKAEVVPTFNPDVTELTLEPFHFWESGATYTLTILSKTHSQDNQSLDKDYQFTFTIEDYNGKE